MVRRRQPADKPTSKQPTVEDVLSLIASLSPQDRSRLGQRLAEQSGTSRQILTGYAVLQADHFDFLLVAARQFMGRAVKAEPLLVEAGESLHRTQALLNEAIDLAGELLVTRQLKRGMDKKTLERLEDIQQLKRDGKTWSQIDQHLGLSAGQAREIVYRNKTRERRPKKP